jgi:hypothetical protein
MRETSNQPNAKQARRIVRLHVAQLSGLSMETFVSDFDRFDIFHRYEQQDERRGCGKYTKEACGIVSLFAGIRAHSREKLSSWKHMGFKTSR